MANIPMIIPGGYITEYDRSIIPLTNITQIGAAFIGPTIKGPAFVPFNVSGINNAVHYFGQTYQKYYTMYAIKNNLSYSNSATIIRMLWQQDYSGDFITLLQNDKVVAVLGVANGKHGETLTVEINDKIVTATIDGEDNQFTLDSSKDNYIAKILSTDPQSSKGVYIHRLFPEDIVSDGAITDGDVKIKYGNYSNASTPYIMAKDENTKLFRFHTITDGAYGNTQVKIAISNIKQARPQIGQPYGSFTVLVRDFDDSDQNPIVLESYPNVNLNPGSSRFIGRVIGSKVYKYDNVKKRLTSIGDYDLKSRYVYIQIEDDVMNGYVSPDTLP